MKSRTFSCTERWRSRRSFTCEIKFAIRSRRIRCGKLFNTPFLHSLSLLLCKMSTGRPTYVALWTLVGKCCNLFESRSSIWSVADTEWSSETDFNKLWARSRKRNFVNPWKYSSGINLIWLCATLRVFKMFLLGAVAASYGGVEGPPHIFFRHHAISYGWHSNSSVGDSNYCYVIRRTY